MAHNSSLGNNVVVVNGALVGGYVEVADRAFISANCLLHQFIRVGTLVMMRGGARASRDLPPYANIDDTHVVKGVNLVGLRRAGFSGSPDRPAAPGLPSPLRPAHQPEAGPGAGGGRGPPDPGSQPSAGIYPRLQTGRGHGPPAGPAGR